MLARIQAWCVAVACTPSSGLAKAIEYMSRRWSKATLFLEHRDVPLDNNGAERAIRGLVLRRKNHCGSKSRQGTEVAAVFYSLIESAKLANIEPADFLRRAALADPDALPTLPYEVACA